MSENDEDKLDNEKKTEQRDFWYKVRAAGGMFTGLVVAILGVYGSIILQSQQDATNKTQLYTQLISEQEKAENAVRKDMFKTILSSFLDKNSEKETEKECVIDKIDRQLLELEMISRNFHESMDLRPLFTHVLLIIVRNIKRGYGDSDENLEPSSHLAKCQRDFFYRFHQVVKRRKNCKDDECRKKILGDKKSYITKVTSRKRDKLIGIAKRITTKQLESLNGVSQRLRFTIELANTCNDTRPNTPDNEMQPCDKEGSEKEPIELVLNEKGTKKFVKRKFTIFSNLSYQRWGQVRIKVTANKLQKEIDADPDGGDFNEAEFWLGYFDFPLVDNTFLSNDERYAVILDSIDDKKAEVSLLYFPASYAGFKEKSYYQHRIKKNLFTDN